MAVIEKRETNTAEIEVIADAGTTQGTTVYLGCNGYSIWFASCYRFIDSDDSIRCVDRRIDERSLGKIY